MNIFCYPGVTKRLEVCRFLGLDSGSVAEFGFMPRVPLLNEATERTEVDMMIPMVRSSIPWWKTLPGILQERLLYIPRGSSRHLWP